MSPDRTTTEPRWRLWREHLLAFWSRDPLTLAASIAFYTALSFAPLLTVAVVALAQLGATREAAFIAELRDLLGPQVASAAELVLARVEAGPPDSLAGAVAFGAILFSASAVFGQMQIAINRLWGLEGHAIGGWRGWLHGRLVAFGMLVGLGMLLLTTFIASSLVSALFAESIPFFAAISEGVASLLIALSFGLMFHYVPYVRPPLWPCLRAGLATALLFQIGKWVLGLYFAHAGLSDAYGPAGVVVLLMAWSYYVSLLVLIGSALARPARASSGLDLRGAESVRDGTARDD